MWLLKPGKPAIEREGDRPGKSPGQVQQAGCDAVGADVVLQERERTALSSRNDREKTTWSSSRNILFFSLALPCGGSGFREKGKQLPAHLPDQQYHQGSGGRSGEKNARRNGGPTQSNDPSRVPGVASGGPPPMSTL